MKTMTEAEIRVAMALLDEEGAAWVDAVRLGRFALYCDCGIHGIFDSREELLASNEYDAAKHSECKHDLAISKITDKNINSVPGTTMHRAFSLPNSPLPNSLYHQPQIKDRALSNPITPHYILIN